MAVNMISLYSSAVLCSPSQVFICFFLVSLFLQNVETQKGKMNYELNYFLNYQYNFVGVISRGLMHLCSQVQAYLYDGYWEDIGTIEAFYNANLGITKKPVPDFR